MSISTDTVLVKLYDKVLRNIISLDLYFFVARNLHAALLITLSILSVGAAFESSTVTDAGFEESKLKRRFPSSSF